MKIKTVSAIANELADREAIRDASSSLAARATAPMSTSCGRPGGPTRPTTTPLLPSRSGPPAVSSVLSPRAAHALESPEFQRDRGRDIIP